MIKLHRLINRLVQEHVDDDTLNATTGTMLSQMRDGYRLGFPVFVADRRVLFGIALVTEAHDARLRAIRQLSSIDPNATHVVVILAYAEEKEWLEQASQIKRLFPEQPFETEFAVY